MVTERFRYGKRWCSPRASLGPERTRLERFSWADSPWSSSEDTRRVSPPGQEGHSVVTHASRLLSSSRHTVKARQLTKKLGLFRHNNRAEAGRATIHQSIRTGGGYPGDPCKGNRTQGKPSSVATRRKHSGRVTSGSIPPQCRPVKRKSQHFCPFAGGSDAPSARSSQSENPEQSVEIAQRPARQRPMYRLGADRLKLTVESAVPSCFSTKSPVLGSPPCVLWFATRSLFGWSRSA
ncbi:hypothetical protein Pla108_32190 [Botrimarina colliarenosi]|uniref:Uncharacterized protein n=1 Tax=Botrimarina colliarenosi TaxID=2528001 RepID=A0A5C6AAA7_9BACT|nr:hypothetical protein Pla108_32190 [Botrimarina colliarenosi]